MGYNKNDSLLETTPLIFLDEIFNFFSIFGFSTIYPLLSPSAGLGGKIQVFSKKKNLSAQVHMIVFENGGSLVRLQNGNERYHECS